jgi:hypothetical protein
VHGVEREHDLPILGLLKNAHLEQCMRQHLEQKRWRFEADEISLLLSLEGPQQTAIASSREETSKVTVRMSGSPAVHVIPEVLKQSCGRREDVRHLLSPDVLVVPLACLVVVAQLEVIPTPASRKA